MRILITGRTGQLGQALHPILTEQGHQVLDVPRFDVGDHSTVQLITDLAPDVVIHAAAMTNVDGCAKDPDAAFRVNAFGTQNVAHGCMRCGADMVAVSTNEVFDGYGNQPYSETDQPAPINPYASSKRSGEQMAANYLKNNLYIVRTAWVYSPGGNNFPAKIIAAADKFGELKVVTDEVGNPTYAPDLAQAISDLMQTRVYGTYHFTNAGYCSRFDFAKEILRRSERSHIPIQPTTLADYQRASTVPPFAPLVNTKGADLGITLRPWQEGLTAYFEATG